MADKTLKPSKFDSILIKADSIKFGTLTISKASRIDDCDFKDIVMTEGQELDIEYPNSAYIVFKSDRAQGAFKMTYSYIKRDSDPNVSTVDKDDKDSFEFSQFHKTPMFWPLVISIGVLLFIVLSVTCCIC